LTATEGHLGDFLLGEIVRDQPLESRPFFKFSELADGGPVLEQFFAIEYNEGFAVVPSELTTEHVEVTGTGGGTDYLHVGVTDLAFEFSVLVLVVCL
jgi:hypothetical protein